MILPHTAKKILIKLMAGRRNSFPATTRLYFKCAIYKHDRIGDFILAKSAIHKLIDHFGAENCVLVISTMVTELAREWFPGTQIIAVPHPKYGLLRGIFPVYLQQRKIFQSFQVETTVSLRHRCDIFQALVFSWIRCTHSIGTVSPHTDLSASEKAALDNLYQEEVGYPESAPEAACLEFAANRRIVEAVTRTPTTLDAMKTTLACRRREVPFKLIVCPFSSEAIKDYPLDKLISALEAIHSPVKIVLCGAPEDQVRLHELEGLLRQKGISSQVLKSGTLKQFIQEIEEAHVVLTMDSAAAHFATAMNKRTVVILGGGHYGSFGPWQHSHRQIWLTQEMECFQCAWKCIHPEAFCITKVESKDVAEAIDTAFAVNE